MHQAGKLQTTLTANLAALFFGGIMTLSFAPWNWWWISIISVAGLMLFMRNASTKSCFWQAFWYGMGLFGAGASWVFVSIHEHGNASVLLAALLTFLFIIAPALSFALPMTLFRFFSHRSLPALIAFPSLWVLAEWFRSWVLTGFPWLYIGYGFVDTPLAGWAPIGGVLSISWVAVFLGAVLFVAIRAKHHLRTLAACLVLSASLWAAGWHANNLKWTMPLPSEVSVGLIQPSLPISTKWNAAKLDEILTLYQNQTHQLKENDIIVWPESAIPKFRHQVRDFLLNVDNEARRNNNAIITGIPTLDFRTREYHNSVIGLGIARGTYHKQHLVPFGEYVPFESWLRGAIDFFDLPMSQFSAGPDTQPLITAQGLNISTSICYEIAFPDLVSTSATQAEVLLTVSNDSWFGDSLGPKQHLQMARMRALENAKPLIRATNDGISALIDTKGKIIATIPAFKQAVVSGKITPHQGKTPFNSWGSHPIILFSAVMLLFALWLGRSKSHE